eukprot:jgi/Hompol1/5919/HPOL_000310-RA
MVSQLAIDFTGYLGGAFLVICSVPQLVLMWRTRSASDVSLAWSLTFNVGLILTLVYLILLQAWAGAIPLALELLMTIAVLISKLIIDAGWAGPPVSVRRVNEGSTSKDFVASPDMPANVQVQA